MVAGRLAERARMKFEASLDARWFSAL